MVLSRSFSKLTDFEEALSLGYDLLPFNFHKLSTDKYLCTNMVGEHLYLKKVELAAFIDGKLSYREQKYLELKTKHFLYDSDSDVAIDLLALKLRTKHHRVSQFTALHIFVVTLRCDYTCNYCQVSRRQEGEGAFEMSKDSADAALRLVFMSPAKALKIEFQGGEPLLNFELIKYIVQQADFSNRSAQKELQFVITTNLSNLNDDVLNFCRDERIYLSTSLDGPEELHNKNRPRPGKNGYEKTVAGIKRIQSEIGVNKVSALMTTTNASLQKPKEIIDEYVKQNLNSIFLRPLSPYGFAIKTKQTEKYNAGNWIDFFKDGLDYIISLNQAGYFLVEQYSRIIMRKLFSSENPGYVDLQNPAGIGISVVVYNYDGDVYASDEARMLKEMGDETFKLGNLHKNTYEEIFGFEPLLESLESSILESAPMCSDCGLQAFCGADPVYHHATQGDSVGKKPLSFFCKKNMAVITHILETLEDPKKQRILQSWL